MVVIGPYPMGVAREQLLSLETFKFDVMATVSRQSVSALALLFCDGPYPHQLHLLTSP